MKKTKSKDGVRSTKNVKNTVGNKIIANRSAGNIGNRSSRKKSNNMAGENRLLNKLSSKGKANYFKIKEYLAESSKFATSEDFAGMSFEEAFDIIDKWLDKCNDLEALDFDTERKINDCLNSAVNKGYLPISFDNPSKEPRTLKTDNRELYNILAVVKKN